MLYFNICYATTLSNHIIVCKFSNIIFLTLGCNFWLGEFSKITKKENVLYISTQLQHTRQTHPYQNQQLLTRTMDVSKQDSKLIIKILTTQQTFILKRQVFEQNARFALYHCRTKPNKITLRLIFPRRVLKVLDAKDFLIKMYR